MKSLGIDWGHREHGIALLAEDGGWVTPENLDARDVGALLGQLREFGGPEAIRIAIERGAPLLPATLAANGYGIEGIGTDRSRRLRELHFPGGAKDDKRDAKTLALAVRHRELGLTAERELSPRAEELRLLGRTRERIVRSRTRAVQQLVDVVRRGHPGLAALDLDFTARYALELVCAYADPRRAARARSAKIERILRRGRVRRLDAQAVRKSLSGHGHVVPDHVAAWCAMEAALLAERIKLLCRQLREVDKAIARAYQEHPDREILRSLPHMGATLSARISARIDQDVVKVLRPVQLQILGGTAPRTRISGKRTGGRVLRRVARDRDLHQALVLYARLSTRSSSWARAFVLHHTGGQLRNRKRLNQALRALAHKWVRIIHTLLKRRELYDEQRHLADLRKAGVPWAPPTAA